METSLCPNGWRLPIGTQSAIDKSFGKLSASLGGPANGATANNSSSPTGTVMSNNFREYPNNFIYSGYITGSSINNRGQYGYYWSSTVYGSSGAYLMSINNDSVSPAGANYMKYDGRSIRCVIAN